MLHVAWKEFISRNKRLYMQHGAPQSSSSSAPVESSAACLRARGAAPLRDEDVTQPLRRAGKRTIHDRRVQATARNRPTDIKDHASSASTHGGARAGAYGVRLERTDETDESHDTRTHAGT